MARITSPSSNFNSPSDGARTTSTPFSVPKYFPRCGVSVASSMLDNGPFTRNVGLKGGSIGNSGRARPKAMTSGPSRGVTERTRALPARTTRTTNLSSGFTSRIILTTRRGASAPVTSLPFTATITSPERMPASAAGPPGLTPSTRAPSLPLAGSRSTPMMTRPKGGSVFENRCMKGLPARADSSATSCAASSNLLRASSSWA